MDKVLRSGTLIHVHGLPLFLSADTPVQTHDGTWELIQELLSHPDFPSSPEPRPTVTDTPDNTAEGPAARITAGDGASHQAAGDSEAGLGTGVS